MLYLFIDKNQVKVLSLKKSILGQFEIGLFSKNYQSELLQEGKIINIDYIASAIKEAVGSLTNGSKEKDTVLILPQESYSYLRIEIPIDIAKSAIDSFANDKVRTSLSINLDEYAYDFYVEEGSSQKYVHYFALNLESLSKLKEALHLIELRIDAILPESAMYFKLFQKTLRKDKKESIFYVNSEINQLAGFLYDSFGQLTSEKWISPLNDGKKVEELLKTKVQDYEKGGKKLNRIILGGGESEKIRQDTFTKEVGVWTNPLKRIFPEFYQEYLKLLTGSPDKPFSVLSYEACVGAFIFHQEYKDFSLSNNMKGGKTKLPSIPKIHLKIPVKELIIFLVSFSLSFLVFFIFSRLKPSFNMTSFVTKSKPTLNVSPSKPALPTSSPTPAFNRGQLKIKILNGSGTVGKAAEVKDILKEKGYKEILTGNADSFDYEKTELQVKKSQKAAATVIKNDLKDNVTSPTESTLDEDEAADVVLIIGTDFE